MHAVVQVQVLRYRLARNNLNMYLGSAATACCWSFIRRLARRLRPNREITCLALLRKQLNRHCSLRSRTKVSTVFEDDDSQQFATLGMTPGTHTIARGNYDELMIALLCHFVHFLISATLGGLHLRMDPYN